MYHLNIFSFQVVSLAKKFVDLHANYSNLIIQLMEKNARTGAPVNPPIWWIAPDDPVALTCDSGKIISLVVLNLMLIHRIQLNLSYFVVTHSTLRSLNFPTLSPLQKKFWIDLIKTESFESLSTALLCLENHILKETFLYFAFFNLFILICTTSLF